MRGHGARVLWLVDTSSTGSGDCIARRLPEFGTIVQLGSVPDIEVLATLDVFTLSP